LAVQLPLGFFFGRQRDMEESKEYLPHTLILSFVLILVTVIGKTFLIQFSAESSALYSIGVSLTLIFSILILVLRTEFIHGLRKSQEIQTMEAVLLAEQRQFEESKQSIQLINAKVHDIKHKLDEFGDKVANDTLEKLKDSVRIYDRQFHTGSQVLDTILYSKSLECDRLGIRLSAIGDGSPLHYIPSSKRYYLFSNILDNAIAAVREVEDPNKRIIGITIVTKDALTEIDAYNYFVGKRYMVHGTLQTTKKDRANHGQGLKSISYVVNEYGGTMDIRIDEDIFTLTIALPAKKKN
nr:ATP-binding protein [Bacilli bacterium]